MKKTKTKISILLLFVMFAVTACGNTSFDAVKNKSETIDETQTLEQGDTVSDSIDTGETVESTPEGSTESISESTSETAVEVTADSTDGSESGDGGSLEASSTEVLSAPSISYPQKGWLLTQYASVTGSQSMFYSLKNNEDGTLILIDGGLTEDAELVKNVISENGGHVDVWFLTHYHPDHAGAFNEVYPEYKDVIDTIYVTPMDHELYAERAQYWDGLDTYEKYLEITADATNIHELARGDEFDIDTLHVNVFNAFDDIVLEKSSDICNDCSLVFKLTAEKNTILFMGDLARGGVPLGQYIIDTYGAENVRADYIQTGHHGNWGQPVTFYEQLMPHEIFMDGPEWLMTGEDYDAKDLINWCAEHDIVTHDFRDAPVSVLLN